MARIARVVIADLAHPTTQRGDGGQFILADDAGRWVYLDLLRWAVRWPAGEDTRLLVSATPKRVAPR